jgi:beta-lactamase regulating signal transducer with metallopeptidase domain
MNPEMRVVLVVLASYAGVSTLVAAAAAAVWRAGLIERDSPSPATRAWRLVALRALPFVVGALVTAIVVTPGYLAFEPDHETEEVGPVLIALAMLGAVLLGTGLLIALRAVIATWRLERQWLQSASAIHFTPPASIPAYVIETLTPVVALIGVFSPKLVAARSVIEVCSACELAQIVAHERGHLRSRDNLKRWLIAAAPDLLRWTRLHDEIESAWYNAAEDAADDAATSGDVVARTDLAALLVKIAGLGPAAPWSAATVSPFVESDSLDRRVRRLLEDEATPAPSIWPAFARIAGVCATALMIAGLFSATALESAHRVVETIIDFGR